MYVKGKGAVLLVYAVTGRFHNFFVFYGGREVHSRFSFAVRGSPSFVPRVFRSCFAVRGSCFAVRYGASHFTFVLRGSRFLIRGSYFLVRASQFVVRGSWWFWNRVGALSITDYFCVVNVQNRHMSAHPPWPITTKKRRKS